MRARRSSAVDACVEELEADYHRQGRLSLDDVDRAVARRRLELAKGRA